MEDKYSDEQLIQYYKNKLGAGYKVTIDSNHRVHISGTGFSATLPRNGNVNNCVTYMPGQPGKNDPQELKDLAPGAKYNRVTFTHQYYADQIMGQNDDTAVFVFNTQNPDTTGYKKLMNELDLNNTNKVFTGYSDGGMATTTLASGSENSTVILYGSSHANKNSQAFDNLANNGGRVLYMVNSELDLGNKNEILNSIKRAKIPLYVITTNISHKYISYMGMEYDSVGFVMGNPNSPLATGDNSIKISGKEPTLAYYKYDYNKREYVPISPSQMQFELAHYQPDRYQSLDYLNGIDSLNAGSSGGGEVVTVDYQKSIKYLNDLRKGISTTNMSSFPNINDGLNAVSEKIESLVDNYVDSSKKVYDKAIELTEKTRDVTCGYRRLDDAFKTRIREEL